MRSKLKRNWRQQKPSSFESCQIRFQADFRLTKLTVEDDVHLRAAEMLSEVQVTLDLVRLLFPAEANDEVGKR